MGLAELQIISHRGMMSYRAISSDWYGEERNAYHPKIGEGAVIALPAHRPADSCSVNVKVVVGPRLIFDSLR